MNSFSSIYVKNAGIKSTSTSIATAFSSLGEIERVDMVEFVRPDGSRGKNAFLHFSSWNTEDSMANVLRLKLHAARQVGNNEGVIWNVDGWKFYVLINDKPLQIEPLNPVQLTKIVQDQRATIEDLQMIVDVQTNRISDLEQRIVEIHMILAGRSMSEESRGPSLCMDDLATEN